MDRTKISLATWLQGRAPPRGPVTPTLELGYPRLMRIGGYVITSQAAQAWAARLENVEKLDPLEVSGAPQFINKVIKPLGVEIRYIGEGGHTHCMIVTQRAHFKGRVGMPPSEIPQFVEGEQETVARGILMRHGVHEFNFETWLD